MEEFTGEGVLIWTTVQIAVWREELSQEDIMLVRGVVAYNINVVDNKFKQLKTYSVLGSD